MATSDDFLAQEYLHVQKVIEDFDTKTLTVKAWSVTFTAVAIGLAYDKHEPVILIVAMVSALTFWLVEALLKVNQQAHYARIEEIEAHFSGDAMRKPFQVHRAWLGRFKANGGYRKVVDVLTWPHVAASYAPFALLAVGLFAFHQPEPAIPDAPTITTSARQTVRTTV